MQTQSLAPVARATLLALVAALAVAVALMFAGPLSVARASGPGGGGAGGGGAGGGGGAPAQTFPAAACDGSLDGPAAGATLVTIQMPVVAANCFTVLVDAARNTTLEAISAAPGWTDTVKKAEVDNLDLVWTNTANPLLTHEYRLSGVAPNISIRVS